MKIEEKFKEKLLGIFGRKIPAKIAVGVSGGIDSMALLCLLNEVIDAEIFALTVDHKLRKNSRKEAEFVAEFCQKEFSKKKIKHQILESYLEEKPDSNIESQLREVRYNLLINFCLDHKINYLFIAHHESDLAENFLIRLFRGSGIDGLAALDDVSYFEGVNLVRPLLEFSKSDLENYLNSKKIKHIHDESNDDEKYLRNKIRKFLNELDDAKNINGRIALASKSILESRKIIEDEMVENFGQFAKFFELGYISFELAKFKLLPQEKALRYLAWFLMEVAGNNYKPRREKLENFYYWILQDKNHKAKSFYGCILEKLDSKNLVIYREFAKIKEEKLKDNLVWDNRFIINSKAFKNEVVAPISVTELNLLIKEKKITIDTKIKKILTTIPAIKENNKIIAVPQLGFNNKVIEVKFKFRTPLRRVYKKT